MLKKYPKHHLIKNGPIKRCQICNSAKLVLILDLGHQPLCDTLVTKKMLFEPEVTYPLRMMWCANCTCVQLDYCVDGSTVYHKNYPYRSGISKPLADYQKNIALALTKKYNLNKKDLVIDIGSNDGTLLSGFKKLGIKHLGVEPTNIAQFANKHGIKTIQEFFDFKLSNKIKNKYGKARIITATNVFAHMQTLGEVITGIHNLLEDGGVFVSETHYLLDVIKGGQFDTIYHEHLRTYSLKALIKLFSYYDFTIVDAERGSRYGGNLRIYAAKGKGQRVSPNVAKFLKEEKIAQLDKLTTYVNFANRAKKSRLEFMEFLIKTKKAGKKIVGKSCPGRASTLLNYYGVDSELLPYLAELTTSLKLGMYLPGKHIPVISEVILKKDKPDYIVLLAWHYAKEIMERLKTEGLKADFVVPLPNLKIIKNSQV